MAKTKKLICNITGKKLVADSGYYNKRVEKVGSEELLQNTYICKDAKQLLKKGYSIEDVQEALNAPGFTCNMTDEEAKNLVSTTTLRLNTNDQPTSKIIKTDPDVKKFIENILKNE